MSVVKKKFDRVILIAVALVTTVFALLLILKGLSYAENFVLPVVTEKQILPENRQVDVEAAVATIPLKSLWVPPDLGGTKPSLFLSVPIVEKDGEIYNMNEEEPKLRDPIDNAWLIRNGLEFLSADVSERDPDGDGFSNLEEFEDKTNPKDPASHPSFVRKLFLLRRLTENFYLEFKADNHPDFQVERTLHSGQRKTWFRKVDDKFGDADRFLIAGFTPKTVQAGGITKNVSQLEVKDLQRGGSQFLVLRTKLNLPTYHAEFRYDVGEPAKFLVKEGDTFKLPGGDDTYRLTKVMEDTATIENVPPAGSGAAVVKMIIKLLSP